MKQDLNHQIIDPVHRGIDRRIASALPEVAPSANATSVELAEDLEQLQNRARERDHYLELLRRTQADFENYQKRVRREREEERRYQHGSFALELLPVLDDLERAIAAADQANDSWQLKQGVELVRITFLNVLRQHGVTPVQSLGQPFDPNLHHARAAKEVRGQTANIVVGVVKQGYRLHDRLLRPAEVIVAIPSERDR